MRGWWLGACAALALSGNAVAGSWVIVEATPQSLTAYDLGSLKRQGSQVSFWSLVGYSATRTDMSVPVDYMLTHDIIDCAADTAAAGYLTAYMLDKDNPVASDSNTQAAKPIVPDTIRSNEEKMVCQGSSMPAVPSDPKTIMKSYRAHLPN